MGFLVIFPDHPWYFLGGGLALWSSRPGCCRYVWKSSDSRRLGVGAVSRAPGFPSSPRGPCGGAGFPCALRPQPGTVVGSDNGKLPPTHPFAFFGFWCGKADQHMPKSTAFAHTHHGLTTGGGRLRVLWPRRSPVHIVLGLLAAGLAGEMGLDGSGSQILEQKGGCNDIIMNKV